MEEWTAPVSELGACCVTNRTALNDTSDFLGVPYTHGGTCVKDFCPKCDNELVFHYCLIFPGSLVIG